MPYPVRWFLLLIILPGKLIFAQGQWSLDQCISYAYENNIQLKQQKLSINMAENNLFQSQMEILPELGIGASQTYRFGRSVDPLTYEFTNENSRGSSFYGSTGVTLFRGFRSLNTIKKSKINLNIILEDYNRAKNDLALNITRFYLQILFNKELEEIAGKQVEVTALQVQNTEKLVKAGSLPQGDLLEIQAQYASEELLLVNARNQLRLSLLELAQLLDFKDIETFDIEEPGFESFVMKAPASSSGQIYESALLMLPRVKSAELNVQLYERDLALSRGLISPSLRVSAGWGSGYSDRIMDFQTGNIMPFWDQFQYASTTSLGISLNVPIFNNYSTQTDIKNKKIALLISGYQLELVKNELLKEIQQATADAEAALEKYQATEKTLTSLQEAFRYTEKKYSLGLLTSLDYNIAKNNLIKAQSDLLQSKYSYIFNIRILDFYSGLPNELN